MENKKHQSKAPKSKRQVMREQRAKKARAQRIVLIGGVILFAAVFFGLLIWSNYRRTNPDVGEFATITPKTYKNADGLKLGDANAKVVIEVFEDFECSHCQKYSQEFEPKVISELVDTGIAYYIFHNYPFLDDQSTIKDSDNAANGSMCAAEQNCFWDFKEILFANTNFVSGEHDPTRLEAFAKSLGLDVKKFSTCMSEKRFQKEIDQDLQLGEKMGVTGTPSIFVNGKWVEGGYAYETIKAAVDAALAGQ